MGKPLIFQKIKERYKDDINIKAKPYINEFYAKIQTPTMVKGKVMGNHGEYTVSLKLKNDKLTSACSCYIGKHGSCHHCTASGIHYLQNPTSFELKKVVKKPNLKTLDGLAAYLETVTLEDMIAELKKKGISQKAFAESIGMSSAHLSAVKKAESRNRVFHELGAVKVACIWIMEKVG